MRNHTNRKLIIFALSTLFLAPYLMGAGNQEVIGTIVKSYRASLAGITIPDQGTLTTNAVLSTTKGGSAWVRFSKNTQAGLSEHTSVRFRSERNGVVGKISSGTIAAKSVGKDALVIETPKFRIEPAPGRQALYMVAMLSDNTTIISARRGNLAVTDTRSGKRYLVPEDHYAKISNAPAGTPGQAAAPSGQAGAAAAPPGLLNSTPVIFALSLGSGMAVGFGVAEGPLGLGSASPSAP